MSQDGPVAPSMTTLIEGYYVVQILDAFQKDGLLDRLTPGTTVDDLSTEFGYEPAHLTALLDYLSLRSDVVRKKAAEYSVDAADRNTQFAMHLLDQYAGAYAPCFAALPDILTGRVNGDALVDRARHANAFARADRNQVDPDILRLLGELRISNFVDLGCSTAGLMIEFSLRHPDVRCIGLDSSAPAVEEARKRIADGGLSGRVRAVQGDLREVGTLIAAEERDAVQCLVASNVANAFFGDPDGAEIDTVFAVLKNAFPSRFMLLGDYFGSLGQPQDDADVRTRGLFHDVAQLMSGQGIPPGDLEGWAEVLERNDCTLIKAFSGEGGDIKRFILLLQL
jgi:SAM-dependent methyltransferase